MIRESVEVRFHAFRDGAKLPQSATSNSSGMDVCAWVSENSGVGEKRATWIPPNATRVINTGLNVSIPAGYEIQVRPRSGLAAKNGITVLNTPGTIDQDYAGLDKDFEIKIILFNSSDETFVIDHGMRIAQLVLMPVPLAVPVMIEDEKEFMDGIYHNRQGGLGSTGV